MSLAFAAIGLVEDFEILMVVDLDEQDADTWAAAFGGEGERLLVAEEILIELAGLGEVFDVDRQMRARREPWGVALSLPPGWA